MFEQFFEQDAGGTLKGLTLEWKCPHCEGLNFRILSLGERKNPGYHTRCRYCKRKYRVGFPVQQQPVDGESGFMDLLDNEDFPVDVRTDMIRDFAEIASLRAENAPAGVIKEKEKALFAKIDLAKRRRH